jgi:hypothetical protein
VSSLKLEGMFVSFEETLGEVSVIFPNFYDYTKRRESLSKYI